MFNVKWLGNIHLTGTGGEGGGLWFFWEKKMSANLIEKKNSVCEMGSKKYSVSTLICALRNIAFVEKKSAALRSEKNILTPKKTISTPPP